MNSQDIRKNPIKKLTLQKEEAVDPLFHLFTDIPLTSFQKDTEFFSKNIKDSNKSHQTPSLRSNRSFFHNSQVDSYQLIDKKTRKNSINQQSHHSNSLSKKVSSYNSIKEQKIKKICLNFMRKLRRNNIFSKPVSEQDLVLSPQLYRKGITINQTFKLYWAVFSWIILVSLFFSQTLVITFSQLKGSQIIQIFIDFGVMFIIGEMGLGFTQIKYKQGKQVSNLTQIIEIYSKRQFFLDASIFLFLLLIIGQFTIVVNQIFVVIILFKLFSLHKRLHIIQNSIIKVILLNLFIAHVISILLNLMIWSNTNDNWQIVKGIADCWWFERYVWSFYWSVAIMTTVGFGGIVPASYSQAIWIIIIEIACCLLLAYNISYVYNNFGKCAKHEITKQTKSFEKIVVNKDINLDLKKKIKEYIVAKDEIQNKMNIQENKNVIQALSLALKKQIFQYSIKNVLKSLPFFDNLHGKVIHSLTQSIQRNIYLPNQMIKTFDDVSNIYILEKGEIGYSCRSYRSKLNNYITDFVKTSRSHLLSLDFISRERQKYDIKSISCSIILKLSLQCLRTHLLESSSSFQFYCYLRDKSRYIIDQYQTVSCKNQCRSKHTMMTCPKLHFMPIQHLVISKYLKNALNCNQRVARRVLTSRMMRRKLNTLNINRYSQEQHSKYSTFSLNRIKQSKGISISEANWNNLDSFPLDNQFKTRDERAEDEMWIIASDNIQNYKRYFPEGNLESIIRKRNLASLMRRETEI